MRDLVFNQDSTIIPFNQRETAVSASVDIAKGIAVLINRSVVQKVIRCSVSWMDCKLLTNLKIKDLLFSMVKDPKYRDVAVLLLTLSQKIPIDSELPTEINLKLKLSDSDNESLLLCAVGDHVAISFPTEEKWENDSLILLVEEITESASIAVRSETVDNLSALKNAVPIVGRYQARTRNILNAKNFWNQKSAAFSRLDFGLDVENQILDINEGKIKAIINKLIELDDCCEEWAASDRTDPIYHSIITGESAQTMAKFAQQRKFRSAVGRAKTFETHARVGSDIRIHFILDRHEKRIEVGYIGPHLPTVSNPT